MTHLPSTLAIAFVVATGHLGAAPTWQEVHALNRAGRGDPIRTCRVVVRNHHEDYIRKHLGKLAAPALADEREYREWTSDSTTIFNENTVRIDTERGTKVFGGGTRVPLEEDPSWLIKPTSKLERHAGRSPGQGRGWIPFPVASNTEFLGTESVGDVEQLVYGMIGESSDFLALVWIAPSIGYQMTRLEVWKDGILRIEEANDDFREVNCVLVPHHMVATYRPDPQAVPVPFASRDEDTLVEVMFNRPLPPDAFDTSWPGMPPEGKVRYLFNEFPGS